MGTADQDFLGTANLDFLHVTELFSSARISFLAIFYLHNGIVSARKCRHTTSRKDVLRMSLEIHLAST